MIVLSNEGSMIRPAALVSLCSFAAAGVVIVWFNDRLDLWGARGAAGLESVALLFLALMSVVMVVADHLLKGRAFEYAVAPLTLIVFAAAYMFGSMRLD